MNSTLAAALARVVNTPTNPTQYDIELVKAVSMVYIADALERMAIDAEKTTEAKSRADSNGIIWPL